MDYKKFDEWSRLGYKILKGSKATWFDGMPMFSEKQVVKRDRRYSVPRYSDWYDEMEEFAPTYDHWTGGWF